MRIIKKVIQVGGSSGIVLDKEALEKMKIEIGDNIVVDIIRNLKQGVGIKKW